MRDSELQALESMRRYRVKRAWLVKIMLAAATMLAVGLTLYVTG